MNKHTPFILFVIAHAFNFLGYKYQHYGAFIYLLVFVCNFLILVIGSLFIRTGGVNGRYEA